MEHQLTVNTSKMVFLLMLEKHIKSFNSSLFWISFKIKKDCFLVTPNLLFPSNSLIYYQGKIMELPTGIKVNGKCKMTFKGKLMYLPGVILFLPAAIVMIFYFIYIIIFKKISPPPNVYELVIIFLGYNIMINVFLNASKKVCLKLMNNFFDYLKNDIKLMDQEVK